jgi:phosphoadenosine phosphosulfate reductase
MSARNDHTRTYDEAQSEAKVLEFANRTLAPLSAEARVNWTLDHLPPTWALTSSFGAQSAVMLHLVTRQLPDVPVIFIDTGYLFPETYRYVDELTEKLSLNLKVFNSGVSAAWQEARHGRRWDQGVSGIDDYNRENKVEPMQRALDDLAVGTWLAGLRRDQADSRRGLDVVARQGDLWKVHPVIDWSDRDVYDYLKRQKLPFHPLWEQGYVSIGDVHTTRSLSEVEDPSELRFFGLKRECGLHEKPADDDATAAA